MTLLVSRATSKSREILPFDEDCGLPKLYDWLLILPQEVKYVWRASWNWSKVLYLLTRYIPFATIALVIRSELLPYRLARLPMPPFWMKPTSSACLDIVFCDMASSGYSIVSPRSSAEPH